MKSLIALFLSLFAVTATAEECTAYMTRRVKEIEALGYQKVDGRIQPTQDGLLIIGVFINTQKGKTILDVVVENERMVAIAAKEGIKKTGTCLLNGQKMFTGTDQQQAETQSEPI